MIKKVSIITLLFSVFLSTTVNCQFINMDQTIEYINGKLKNSCIIDTKKADLLVTFYENGNETRIDRASFEMLDQESVEYNCDEKAIIIKCTHREDCIYRKLVNDKVKKFYSRINIPYEGDSISNKGLEKAFKHLILLVKYDSYKSDVPFE